MHRHPKVIRYRGEREKRCFVGGISLSVGIFGSLYENSSLSGLASCSLSNIQGDNQKWRALGDLKSAVSELELPRAAGLMKAPNIRLDFDVGGSLIMMDPVMRE